MPTIVRKKNDAFCIKSWKVAFLFSMTAMSGDKKGCQRWLPIWWPKVIVNYKYIICQQKLNSM